MLRKELGDDVFYQSLQDYLVDPDFSYGYAKSLDKAFSFFVEPKLINPTFIINYFVTYR